MKQELTAAEVIWDFLFVGQNLEVSDCIIVCGGHDSQVVDCAEKLYKEGYAKYIVVSGGLKRKIFGIDTEKIEAEIMAELLYDKNIPRESVFLETKAINTTENFVYSDTMMSKLGHDFNKYIIIQKPYVEKRTIATLELLNSCKKIIVTSNKISFNQYISQDIPEDKILNMLVGEIQRLIEYPSIGWTVCVDIPNEVIDAYYYLIDKGYTERLFTSETLERFKKDANYFEVK